MLQKIKEWLGIAEIKRQNVKLLQRQKELEELISTLSSGVVDVHFRSQSQIYIVSKLNDGYFTHIDADFKGYNELIDFAKQIKNRFGGHRVLWDDPPNMKGIASQIRKDLRY